MLIDAAQASKFLTAKRSRRQMRDFFGEGCCRFLNIREKGGVELRGNG